jgi:RimJ/RimL family protein N-acetyltransferase
LTLVPKTPDQVRAEIQGVNAEQRALMSPDWIARVQSMTQPDPWTLGFSLVERTTGVSVGVCGFTGPPKEDGVLEIAYGIESEHQGRGYATEAAGALVAYAVRSGKVRIVCAHTLPEANASGRVLTKCGFRHVGEVIHPEDGRVWRWEIGIAAAIQRYPCE